MTATGGAIDRELVIRSLERERSRSGMLRASGLAFAALVVYAWTSGGFEAGDLISARRLSNVQRFVSELRPHVLQGREWDFGAALGWATDLTLRRAAPAAVTTLAIAVAAITIAGTAGLLLALPAARPLASPEPYLPSGRLPAALSRAGWRITGAMLRALLLFLRAVPEYIWAFVLLAALGPTVWAAVLALALHNVGILGKLNAEVIEHLDQAPLSGLRAAGATRLQIVWLGIRPAVLPRLLLFFFYRWETCVREATVLGMLGIVSLGFYIQDARVRQYYDVMFVLILSGAVLVVAGDLVSAAARGAVRRSR
ncbi:MAG TPA: ABC transporter permease subunit [Vicinamibacterales bacterium]|nr:ABC transporter permease subunit [Vicinamibacterales bacterium]